jgi:hypothetical protein
MSVILSIKSSSLTFQNGVQPWFGLILSFLTDICDVVSLLARLSPTFGLTSSTFCHSKICWPCLGPADPLGSFSNAIRSGLLPYLSYLILSSQTGTWMAFDKHCRQVAGSSAAPLRYNSWIGDLLTMFTNWTFTSLTRMSRLSATGSAARA